MCSVQVTFEFIAIRLPNRIYLSQQNSSVLTRNKSVNRCDQSSGELSGQKRYINKCTHRLNKVGRFMTRVCLRADALKINPALCNKASKQTFAEPSAVVNCAANKPQKCAWNRKRHHPSPKSVTIAHTKRKLFIVMQTRSCFLPVTFYCSTINEITKGCTTRLRCIHLRVTFADFPSWRKRNNWIRR